MVGIGDFSDVEDKLPILMIIKVTKGIAFLNCSAVRVHEFKNTNLLLTFVY